MQVQDRTHDATTLVSALVTTELSVRSSRDLLEVLRCPSCGDRLEATENTLTCQSCATEYPLEGGVPCFAKVATGEGREAGVLQRGLHTLAAQPRIYDALGWLFGANEVRQRLGVRLAPHPEATVLDLGAGTGSVAEVVPSGAAYVWLDSDPLKLRGFLAKTANPVAVLADATRLPFASKSVDWSASVAVSHHLDAQALEQFISEASRVTRECFVFLDAVASLRLASRALWKYDRGAWPRTSTQLEQALAQRFELQHIDTFRVVHEYVVITCKPRDQPARATADS
jgi:SAM-dependent methyltransferase